MGGEDLSEMGDCGLGHGVEDADHGLSAEGSITGNVDDLGRVLGVTEELEECRGGVEVAEDICL